jgi:predicted AlkP superfamily pyrophosphatase or phosphodiesterase
MQEQTILQTISGTNTFPFTAKKAITVSADAVRAKFTDQQTQLSLLTPQAKNLANSFTAQEQQERMYSQVHMLF